MRSIRRSRRRVVAHLILLVIVALFRRQATFSPIQWTAWSLPRHCVNHKQRKTIILYSGKLLREKTFDFFHSFRTIRESFLRKILWPCLHYNWTLEIFESLLCKILVLNRNAKVFPPKGFRRTVISTHIHVAIYAFTLRADLVLRSYTHKHEARAGVWLQAYNGFCSAARYLAAPIRLQNW